MSAEVLLDVDGHVAVITLSRPPVNALSSSTYRELSSVLVTVGGLESVQAVVMRSSCDRAFCAGADVNELATLVGDDAHSANVLRQELARQVFDQLMYLRQPTIAVVDGPAIGAGAVLASCCDMRIGTARSSFVLPEINVGRCGGGRHLMRHLPQGVVRKMYFTGQALISEDALRFGLVDSVHPSETVLDVAMERARTIAMKSPIALRLAKAALNESEPLPTSEGYAIEQEYTLKLALTHDAQEALAARREGRPARFTGH